MLSTHKSERKQSNFEVMDNCILLKKQVRELSIVRNFGYKFRAASTPRNIEVWSEESKKRWLEREQARLEKLKWLDIEFLHERRKEIDRTLMGILYEISCANSIYRPVCMAEADERRLHQDRAIMHCEYLRLELQDIIDTVPIEKNWMLQVEPVIDKEIGLIKAWRKSDNDTRKSLIQKSKSTENAATQK